MIRCLHLTSGRGPVETCWVVSETAGKIIREAEAVGLAASLVESVPGEVAGTLKSALIAVEGKEGVEEFVSSWTGTVQWIGQSMFRPKHKRKNWFIGVEALDRVEAAKFDSKDIRIKTMKASGPGGQHVNKTETAVRATHLPTGISVVAREERSQHLNRKLALDRLRAELENVEAEKREEHEQGRWNRHNSLERGNAVRVFEGRKFKEKRR